MAVKPEALAELNSHLRLKRGDGLISFDSDYWRMTVGDEFITCSSKVSVLIQGKWVRHSVSCDKSSFCRHVLIDDKSGVMLTPMQCIGMMARILK